LVAQDTTAYGTDLARPASLASLLRDLLAQDGPEWIRVLYTHPNHWSDELIGLFADGGRLLPYVDLPIQHISDRVLAAMRRGHTGDALRRLLARLRAGIPRLVLRTTVMTGHPGEGEAEFRELLQFLREFPFDRLGAFAYSPETEMRTASLSTHPEPAAVHERQSELLKVQRAAGLTLQRARCGQTLPVLLEGMLGRSYGEAPEIDGLVHVQFPPAWDLEAVELGEFLPVRIEEAGPHDLYGVAAVERDRSVRHRARQAAGGEEG
jgi:ribosomal protein S12 methylthiotransferase